MDAVIAAGVRKVDVKNKFGMCFLLVSQVHSSLLCLANYFFRSINY